MPADPSIIVTGSVSDLPFHPPATEDKRDTELAFERLDQKIVGSVTRVTTLETGLTAANASIATNTASIATNATGIATNATDIATNATDIATNTTNITTNATNLTSAVSTINTALAAKVDEDGTISNVTLPYPNYQSGDFSGTDNYNQMSIANWNNGSFSQQLYYKLEALQDNILELQTKINQIATAMRG